MSEPFLVDWMGRRKEWLKAQREAREAADPGYPGWYGTATGEPTEHPWSAVSGARERLPSVFNLDNLRKNVYSLLGVKP